MARTRKSNKKSDKAASSVEATEEVTETAAAADTVSAETDAKLSEDTPPEKPMDTENAGDSAAKADDTDTTSESENPVDATAGPSDATADDVAPGADAVEPIDKTEADAAAAESEGEKPEGRDEEPKAERADEPEDVAASAAQEDDPQRVDASDVEGDEKHRTDEVPEAAQEAMAPPVAPERHEPKPEPQVIRGSMWPAFFGGVIAALVGFIAGRGDMLDQYLPASMQRASVDLTEIEAKIEEQTATLAAQSQDQIARIEALESVANESVADTVSALESDLAGLTERLDAIESEPAGADGDGASSEAVAALQTALADLQAKITALEASTEPAEAVSSLETALAAQEERIAEQAARIAELAAKAEEAETNAASEAQRILARAALARVETAVDSGEGFSSSLSDLEEVAPVEVPTALRDAAEGGVPTLASLQDSFPDAARAGLAAARAEVPESDVAGITGFLKRQLNVRSVTPREGSDPDAVLSRAQAAVRVGDLTTALTEMEALPEVARTAMSDWLEAATARKAAQDAARELADSLNSN